MIGGKLLGAGRAQWPPRALLPCSLRLSSSSPTPPAGTGAESGQLPVPNAAASARAQTLFSIRSAATAAAESMSVWSIGTKRHFDTTLKPLVSLDHIVKRPRDSLITVLLPFGSNAALRAQYVNWRGQIRVGKLLEELDAFAGNIAYLHVDDGDPTTELPVLVTASTDRVDLVTYPLLSDRDMQMRGCVTYCGATSMNIDIDFSTVPRTAEEPATPILLASMTFVARSARTGGPLRVPRLQCELPWEQRLRDIGLTASESRKSARLASLDKTPPSSEELAQVHSLFMELNQAAEASSAATAAVTAASAASAAAAPTDGSNGSTVTGGGVSVGMQTGETAGAAPAAGGAFMESSRVVSHHLTMPQDRNIHGRVFGGWLMRQAFETAWAAGWAFTGSLPKFLALDDVTFRHPVDIGTIVRFDARVTFAMGAPHKTYGVSVSATQIRPQEGKRETTNTFFFTFHSDSGVPRVFPRTYQDAMDFIDGGRRNKIGRGLFEQRQAEGVKLRFDFPDPVAAPSAPR